ncbi:MAG: hypothetical protein IPF68_16805 [Bacteroidales bacterium]|nr:hypothetical protein [Bacteroidales bacterium]
MDKFNIIFDIYIVTSGDPAPIEGSAPTVNDHNSLSYTWSGGIANTTYDWYVRADCEAGGGTGQSDWSGPNTFKTSCNAIDLPYTEGFESMTTDFNCWSVMGNTATQGGLNGNSLVPISGNTWFVCTPASFTNQGATYIHSGTRSAALGYTAPDFNWLVSSDINMPATGSVNLKFLFGIIVQRISRNSMLMCWLMVSGIQCLPIIPLRMKINMLLRWLFLWTLTSEK